MDCIPVSWLKGEFDDIVVDMLTDAAGDDGILCWDEYVKVDESLKPFIGYPWEDTFDRFDYLASAAEEKIGKAEDDFWRGLVSASLKEGDYAGAAKASYLISDWEVEQEALAEIGKNLSNELPQFIAGQINSIAKKLDVYYAKKVAKMVLSSMWEVGLENDAPIIALKIDDPSLRQFLIQEISLRRFNDLQKADPER